MPGPRPNPSKPYSKHRAAARALVVLPAAGCDLPAPRIPSGRRWSTAERKLWKDLWSSPQAVMWDDSAATLVGQYIAHSAAVLAGTAAAWQAAEARQLADRLGLTPTGLASLGWRISEVGEVADLPPLRAVQS